jgi:hypothetical protein
MRWRVLVIRRWTDPLEPILGLLEKVGVEPVYECVDTVQALRAALDRQEWELVIYDPMTRKDVPIELVYTHAPAAAIVVVTDPADMADELARLVASHIDTAD